MTSIVQMVAPTTSASRVVPHAMPWNIMAHWVARVPTRYEIIEAVQCSAVAIIEKWPLDLRLFRQLRNSFIFFPFTPTAYSDMPWSAAARRWPDAVCHCSRRQLSRRACHFMSSYLSTHAPAAHRSAGRCTDCPGTDGSGHSGTDAYEQRTHHSRRSVCENS